MYLLAGGLTVATLLPELRSLTAAAEYGLLSLSSALDGVRAVVAVAIGLRGARTMAGGIGGVTRTVMPSTAPADLPEASAEGALVRRELASSHPGIGYQALRRWFPGHVPLLTGRMRTVGERGLAELGRVVRVGLFVAAGFGLLAVFPSVRDALLGGLQPAVPAGFLLLCAGAAVAHAVLVVRALPATAPRADVREFRASARGGGDPSHMSHALQQELGAIRAADAMPNRARESGFALQAGGVRDAGTIEGRLFIETQPRFTGMADATSARALLAVGAVVQLIALPWWLGSPETPATLIAGASGGIAASLHYAWQLATAWIFGAIGTRMVASGGDLLRGFRFESLAILLDVRGSFARSHLRVGKGMYDSIESDNLVIRSDLYVSGHTAALLTESSDPLGPRSVVGMIANDRTAEVELLVQRYLWRFEREPATIAPVNLRDGGLLEVMQANLGVEARRAAMAPLPATGGGLTALPPER